MILCRFRYRPEDVVCKYCTKYRRGGCALPVCPWLEERIEAGVVTYSSLAAEFYQKWRDSELGIRIEELLSAKKSVSFLDFSHAVRLAAYAAHLAHHHKDGNGNRRLAALYLLTATETLRRCAIPRTFDLWSIDIGSWGAMRTLSEQEYVLFQAAKGIWLGQNTISVTELCDRELVEDKTLSLILDALLIAHYGKAVMAANKGAGV